MHKFYIQRDYQQQGPFSTDELKDLKITRDTMVWFEGQDDWAKAKEIPILNEIFNGSPSDSAKISSPPIAHKSIDLNSSAPGTKAKNPNTTLIITVVAILFIGGLGALIYSDQQTKQTRIQRQLEEQNAKIIEQEKIESIRLAKEEEQRRVAEAERRQAALNSLRYEYDQAITNFRVAKLRLGEIQQFQLLRTASEKQQQVKEQLDKIRFWENKVEKLKEEIGRY